MSVDRRSDDEKVSIEEAINEAGFGLYSYLMICLTGLGIISFACIGYGSTILIPASACELETSGGQQGALAAAPVVGTILGTLLWGYLADTRGRKKMLIVSLLGSAAVNAVGSISVNWIMLMLIQFIAAFFASGLFSMFMSLMSESVPLAKRNLVVLLATSIFLLSQGIMAVLAIPIIPLSFSYYLPALGIFWNSWRTLMIVYSIPSIITATWLFFMHESPKFLFALGNEEQALENLKAIYKVNKMSSLAEFPVKGIWSDQLEKKDKESSPKDQIVPLFRKPLLKYTVIMTFLFVFQTVGAFMVWLPTILNQFINVIQSGEGTNLTMCGVLRLRLDSPVEVEPDANPCAINVTALLMVLSVGAMQSVVNTLISLIINKAGRRNITMVVTGFCGLCGILVNIIPNAYGSVVMFGIFLMGIVVFGLYTAIIVALFPTHLRALAIALPLTGGRMAAFAFIQILNSLLINNCDVGFYVFCSVFFSSAIVASFLPDDRRLASQTSNAELLEKEESQESLTPRSVTEL